MYLYNMTRALASVIWL